MFRNPNKEALTYMEKKYGEKFSYIGPTGSTNGGDTSSILVSCSSLPGAEILVRFTRQSTGEFQFLDNFMAFYYQQDVCDLLKDIATEIYGKCKISYSVIRGPLPDYINKDTTFQEYIEADVVPIPAVIVVSADASIASKDEDIQQLRDRLNKSKLFISGRIYYANESSYSLIDASTISLSTGPKNWCLLFCSFSIDSNGEFKYIDWK